MKKGSWGASRLHLELTVSNADELAITHAAAMSADALATAVRETLAEAAASGAEMTARNVRHAVEKKLGLPPDGLLDRKEELMGLISATLNNDVEVSDARVDSQAVREVQLALEDPDGGPTKASVLVAELTAASTGESREASEAMALLAEACATSEGAARRLLDAQITGALASYLPPTAPKSYASLAIRLLSAMALHGPLTEALVRSSCVAPLLGRLSISIDGSVGVQCATLLHNLADSPATRMRLLHAGALEVIIRVIVEPAASDGLKEHLLTALHSLAGVTEEGLAVPDLIGRFIAAKLPGTQRSGLSSLQILREKHGSAIDGRLAGCEGLVEGLTAASSSGDKEVAAEAAEVLGRLRAAR